MDKQLLLPSEFPENFQYTDEKGLTTGQAQRLKAEGKANALSEDQGKTVWQILTGNCFTLFNFLNFALGICLFLVGSYRNMTFLLIVIANILIGTIQEFRAQKTIRELQLLNAPTVHVLRDGLEVTCKPEETVAGDLTILRAGDQVVADCVVVSGSGNAMESLLTGESDAIPKTINSWLYSGSYITEGRLTAQMIYVGDESYAGRLTREARKTARPGSRLMEELNRLIRFDSMILVPLGILLFLKQILITHSPITEAVPSSVAAMIGMIPEGLVLLTSIAMAVGVIRLGQRNALVQELAGIETLARSDVLCLDKTGTITTGNMTVDSIEGFEATEEEMRQALSRFLGAFDDQGGTLQALRKEVPPGTEKPKTVVPFSSKRKKSAATFNDGTALILGAPEFVLEDRYPPNLRERVNALAEEGKRILVLVQGTGIVTPEAMPEVKKILGIVCLQDELRPGAEDTLRYFREQGVTLKVISGDNPLTVSRIARQAGLEGWESLVDASTLDTDEKLEDACETYTIFGRVSPEQKKALVSALKKKGYHVAMTGDGVNDIPALKTADCSIAMAGGSDAARHAAQLTLLDSDFAVMPEIVLEGRKVINNITRAASLFLMKTLFSFGLSILMLLFPSATYPFKPIQMTLVSALMVGIPGFFLALEPNRERIRGEFLRTVLGNALPGGAAVTLCASIAMSLTMFGWDSAICSTIATVLAGVIGFTVLAMTCLPLNKLRLVLLAAMAAGFTAACCFLPDVFYLVTPDGKAWIALAVLSLIGAGMVVALTVLIRKRRERRER